MNSEKKYEIQDKIFSEVKKEFSVADISKATISVIDEIADELNPLERIFLEDTSGIIVKAVMYKLFGDELDEALLKIDDLLNAEGDAEDE